ncbi:hypothetical protein ABIA33_002941 [Streptacidiphilus sp. MAP12-16]|uniref:hypothetical protein n=1 Tax=Streptacidiphilus sp. MAP12-16 TaxID=3156300 RepID=UPI003516F9A5
MQRQLGYVHQDAVPIPRLYQDPPREAEGDPQHASALSPVFVDSSGRRQRRVRRLGRLLIVPAAAYVALLVSTLLGGPTIQSPLLPLPAPPAAQSAAPGTPAVGVAQPSAGGSHNSVQGHTAGSQAGNGASAAKGTGPTAGATPPASTSSASASAPASAPASASATTAAPTHGNSTHSASPPGASHRATPSKKA